MDASVVARVRQIIAASGRSQRDLADEIGIDGPKLTKSLRGTRQFSSYELAALAEIAGRSVEWILTGNDAARLSFAHRSTIASPETVDNPGREYAVIVAERYADARSFGFVDEPKSLPTPPRGTRYVVAAEQLAATAGALIGSPVSQLDWPGLLASVERAFDVNIAVDELAEGIDGLSLIDGDTRIVVIAPTDRSGRQRFTLAHELGHILFRDGGRHVIEEQLFETKSHDESRANAFAASFLMPKDEISEWLVGRDPVDVFSELVWDFRVSPDSMAWRLFNLELISAQDRAALSSKTLSRVARSLDRVDEHLARIEASRSMRAAASLADAYIGAYLAGLVGSGPVSDVSGLPTEVIERLLEEVQYPDQWPNAAAGE